MSDNFMGPTGKYFQTGPAALRGAMTSSVAALLAASVLWLGGADARGQGSAPRRTATVYFHVVDRFGVELPYDVSEFLLLKSGPDYSSRFVGLLGRTIPYGQYSYKLRRRDAPEAGVLDGTVNVTREEVWRTVMYGGIVVMVQGHAAEGLQATPPGFVIRGTVRPRPGAGDPAWVRIEPVYGATAYETRVDENGEFRIEEFLRGNYVIVVLQGARVLYCGSLVARMYTDQPRDIVVDLANPAPGAIFVH
jgi:hypothetical protein